jgi:hypothetical protein
MKKEFISYEQALALKELGFDEPCLAFYTQNAYGSTPEQKVQYWREPIGGNDDYVFILAPLYQQVFRWFREKYNLFCEIQIDRTTEPKFCFDIFQYEHFGNYEKIEVKEWYLYRTQEEVELECLKKLIEIING